MTGTVAETLPPPTMAQSVGKELDLSLKLCHHPNPAMKSCQRLERLLQYAGPMNSTEIFGLLCGSFESPTLSRPMARAMQEAILAYLGRVRGDRHHEEYWKVVKGTYDKVLVDVFHKCMCDGMTRSHFLRAYRCQLHLF